MLRAKRFAVVFALAGYLLATTAVHLLHDHSEAADSTLGHSTCAAAGSGDHHDDCPRGNCEDFCAACRILAVKSISATVVAFAVQIEILRPVETLRPVFTPVDRPALPLSRAPPCV